MTDRRRFLASSLAFLAAAPALAPLAGAARAQGAAPALHVVKDANCGCCSAWIDILRAEGFAVTTENSFGAALMRHKAQSGVPAELASCHTAHVEGYFIEGHVPVAEIRRLLAEQPAARGLTVPGMPYGSPGMGPESEREAYDVLLVGRDGAVSRYARYDAAT